MSKIVIDTSILPIKENEVAVVPTGTVGDLVRKTLIAVLEAAEPKKDEEYIDYIKRQDETKHTLLTLLKNVLRLTTKQVENINADLEESEINNYASYVCTVLQGLTTGTYAEFKKAQSKDEEETDPKSAEEDD